VIRNVREELDAIEQRIAVGADWMTLGEVDQLDVRLREIERRIERERTATLAELVKVSQQLAELR
jgi:hypothetical protein